MRAERAGEETMDRLLIRLPNWLGDTLMARPLLAGLKARFPGSHRIAVGAGGALDLLAADDGDLELYRWPASAAERGQLASTLRAKSPAAALVLPHSFSSALFAWHCGAPRRVGYAAEGRTPLLTEALRRIPRGERHLSEEYGALGERISAPAKPPAPLPVAESWRSAARARLAEAGVAEGRFAVLAPGAIYGPAKRWPAERFAALAEALAGRGLTPVLVGAEEDRAACEEVAGRMKTPAVSLCGRTRLTELAGLASIARVVVSNDSGVAHVAGAIGVPTVAIFGSTSSAWTAPLGPRVRVVQRAPVCSPCFRRTCRIGYRCLAAVEVAHVERTALELAA